MISTAARANAFAAVLLFWGARTNEDGHRITGVASGRGRNLLAAQLRL
jgi:hypothetical protein